uniref:hypothetical protein n=1 Tax=Streptomyces chartreusis TaxID=1969 RepID=UPI003F494D60
MVRDTSGGNPGTSRWTTAVVRPALGDLFVRPFALRPLPAMPDTPGLARLRRMPHALRPVEHRLPHLAVSLLAAGVAMAQIGFDAIGGPEALIAAIPVALTLLMPAAAWWLTIVMALLASYDLFGLGSLGFAVMFTTGPLVLALCALRLGRPTVLSMYLISSVVVTGSSFLQGLGLFSWFLVNGVTVTVAFLVQGWMQAGARATQQATAA